MSTPPRTCFNSRTLGRVRQPNNNMIMRAQSFNSRTLGRVRLSQTVTIPLLVCFNSRTLGRVRRKVTFTSIFASKFQFTHPGKGATLCPSRLRSTLRCFNSRTLGRVRPQYPTANFLFYRCFNSRTLGRVRRATQGNIIFSREFQFTHPGKGATVWCKVAYYRADKQA